MEITKFLNKINLNVKQLKNYRILPHEKNIYLKKYC